MPEEQDVALAQRVTHYRRVIAQIRDESNGRVAPGTSH